MLNDLNSLVSLNPAGVPAALRAHNNWVAWIAVPNKKSGGYSKPPLSIKNGCLASPTKPEDWSSYDSALAYYKANRGKTVAGGTVCGLGIALTEAMGIVAVDLDGCVQDGKISDSAAAIVASLGGLAELSPSGTGVHLFLRAALPPDAPRRKGNVEIYNDRRYLTVTGRWLGKPEGYRPDDLPSGPDIQVGLDALIASMREPHGEKRQEKESTEEKREKKTAAGTAGDAPIAEMREPQKEKTSTEKEGEKDLIEKLRGNPKFAALFDRGDTAAYNGDDSAADLALCNILAWAGCDAAAIDTIFRQSRLMRPKWDEGRGKQSYGELTIAKAIEGVNLKKNLPPFLTRTPAAAEKTDTAKNPPTPNILIRDGEEPQMLRKMAKAIVARNETFKMYTRGGALVNIKTLGVATSYARLIHARGSVVISPMNPDELRIIAGEAANWGVETRLPNVEQPVFQRKNPPMQLMKSFCALGGTDYLPTLTNVVRCPQMLEDGSVSLTPGYDPTTGLYNDIEPNGYDVPAAPTREDAEKALAFLTDDVLMDFPFETDLSRSVALAALLSVAVQYTVDNIPMIILDSSTPGTGKTTLGTIIALTATGRGPATMTLKVREEDEKAYFSALLRGTPVIMIDNVACDTYEAVSSDFLSSALTQPSVDGRILGQSKIIELPSQAIWIMNGNNIAISTDLVRRVLACRLDAGIENPEARDFSRPNIDQWVIQHRTQIISAILTILRAFIQSGEEPELTPMASFYTWSKRVRGALAWLDQPDPLASQASMRTGDPEYEEFAVFLQAWQAEVGEKPLTVGEMRNNDLLFGMLKEQISTRDAEGNLSNKTIGRWFMKHRGRIIGGLQLVERGKDHAKNTRWTVIQKS